MRIWDLHIVTPHVGEFGDSTLSVCFEFRIRIGFVSEFKPESDFDFDSDSDSDSDSDF